MYKSQFIESVITHFGFAVVEKYFLLSGHWWHSLVVLSKGECDYSEGTRYWYRFPYAIHIFISRYIAKALLNLHCIRNLNLAF